MNSSLPFDMIGWQWLIQHYNSLIEQRGSLTSSMAGSSDDVKIWQTRLQVNTTRRKKKPKGKEPVFTVGRFLTIMKYLQLLYVLKKKLERFAFWFWFPITIEPPILFQVWFFQRNKFWFWFQFWLWKSDSILFQFWVNLDWTWQLISGYPFVTYPMVLVFFFNKFGSGSSSVSTNQTWNQQF
jgi:hypothetical protein